MARIAPEPIINELSNRKCVSTLFAGPGCAMTMAMAMAMAMMMMMATFQQYAAL